MNKAEIAAAASLHVTQVLYQYSMNGKLMIWDFIGFVVAMAGVSLISFNGRELELNPIGDILAVLAASQFKIGAERFTDMTVLFNLLYLGLGASDYWGIANCGPKKKVNKLTGSMALLR